MSSRKRAAFYKSRPFTLALLIAVIALALFIAQRNNDTDNNAPNQAASQAASDKGDQSSKDSQATGTDKSPAGNNTTPLGEGPKTPYGSFVSSHSAQLNSPQLSTCLSSAGAKCKISFNKDSVTKILDEKTTDSDGAAYWNWKPQDLGLTAGSWKITVEANLNGKTATTTDSRNLEIEP